MFLKLGAAAAFIAAVLVFGIGDQDVTRKVFVALFAVWGLVLVNRREWSVGASGLMLLACLFYFAVAILWSLDWRQGVHQLAQIAPFAVLFLVLSRTDRVYEFLPRACVVLIVLALALENAFPGVHGGFGNRNFIAETIVISAPFAALVLREGNAKATVAIAAFGWALFYLTLQNQSNIPTFAAVFVACVLLARMRGGMVAVLLAANGAAWLVALKGARALDSVVTRLELLYNTFFAWIDAPFFGNGSGSFNYAYATYQEKHLAVFPGRSILGNVSEYAGAAHNEIAQILAEHGLFGLVLALLFVLILVNHWRRKKRDALDTAAAWSLGLTLWLSLVGFPLHNAATALIAVVAAAVAARGERARFVGQGCSVAPAYVGGITALAILGTTLLYAGAQHRLAVARATISTDGMDSLYAVHENLASYYLWPFDQLVRRQLIMTVAKATIDYGDRLKIEPQAADRIYAISKTAGPTVPSTLFARANYLLATGRFRESGEIEDIIAQLKRNSSIQAMTWYADAVYSAATGNVERTRRSVHALLSRKNLGLSPEKIERMTEDTIKEMIQ